MGMTGEVHVDLEQEEKKLYLYSLAALAFVGAVIVITPLALLGTSWEDRGNFGAMFGFANAVFSGVAAIGVLLTLSLQRLEFKRQRAEYVDAMNRSIETDKTKLTLGLYKEWHGPVLLHHRIRATALVQNHEDQGNDIPSLSRLEAVQRGRVLQGALVEDANSVFSVFHFFEKWSLLKRNGLINDALMADFSGSFVAWWREHLFNVLVEKEQNEEFLESLLAINKVLCVQQ